MEAHCRVECNCCNLDWQCRRRPQWQVGSGDAAAQQSGSSRTAVYTHAQRVVQAVTSEQAGGISYEPCGTKTSGSAEKPRCGKRGLSRGPQ